jgi:hypothetical protein
VALFTSETLEKLTGIPVDPARQDAIFANLPKLHSTPLSPARAAELIAEIEATIITRRHRQVGGQEGQEVWERGWREVAERLRDAPSIGIEALKPQYFHLGVPFRLLGEYVHPDTDYYEYYAGLAVRRHLVSQFLDGCTNLLELGCGTGINLLLAADLFPAATLVGSDWTRAVGEILALLSRGGSRSITPVLYNMLDGSGGDDLPITPTTDVLTVHALEQLGAKAPAIIELLREKRPRRVLHIEPILEFYAADAPFDDIARRYHLARGYLEGLAPTLHRLAAAGEIELLGECRVRLGNTFHEAYSYIAWRPV